MKRNLLGYLLLIGVLTACGDSSPGADDSKSEQPASQQIDVAAVVNIIRTRCSSCHSVNPSDEVFKVAPGGVLLENLDQMQNSAARIFARAVIAKNMPFMNKTQMTEQERALVGQWTKAGAPAK